MSARSRVSVEERGTATIIDVPPSEERLSPIQLPEGMDPKDYDPDSEEGWQRWAADLHQAKATGKVTAYKLPIDKEGRATFTKGTSQVLLGAWPHDQYEYDDLVAIILRDFLEPGEKAAIRFVGSRAGVRGIQFNRIVMVQKPGTAVATQSSQISEIAALMRGMQESQLRMFQQLTEKEEKPQKSGFEIAKELSVILAPILGPALVAWISRPAVKSDLAQLIGAMKDLKGLTGDDDGCETDTGISGIIKAVAPQGLALLTELAKKSNASTPPIPPRNRQRHVPQIIQNTVAASNGASSGGTTSVEQPAGNASIQNEQRASDSQSKTMGANEMLSKLAPELDKLADLAEAGADPNECAKLVLDFVPEELDDQLGTLVNDPDAFKRLLLLSPRAKAQESWFEALRAALAKEFSEG